MKLDDANRVRAGRNEEREENRSNYGEMKMGEEEGK